MQVVVLIFKVNVLLPHKDDQDVKRENFIC